MKFNSILNNLFKVSFLAIALIFASCDEDDTILEGPITDITSSQFDDTYTYKGTNDEDVKFIINTETPNGLDFVTAELIVNNEVDENLFSYTSIDKETEFHSEEITLTLTEEYIDQELKILIITSDVEGLIDSLQLFITAEGKYTNGFFIVNEGAWGGGNASLSYFDKESSTITNNLFQTLNNKPLGDQAQSMSIIDNKGYIVVQNSAKIEVININTGELLYTLDASDGITSPRYIIAVGNDQAYLSDWGADGTTGTIKVLDLTNNEIIKSISTGNGPNQMVKKGNKVYVALNGGWGSARKVAVINTDSNELESEIEVGDNPSSIVIDAEDNIWVAGNGATAYNDDWSIDLDNSTPGFIAKINSNNEVEIKIEASEIGIGPKSLIIDETGTTLIFNFNQGVSTLATSIDANANTTSFTEIIAESFYGLAIDSINNEIIGCVAPDFSSNGSIKRYSIEGSFIDEFEVGIGPNGIAY